MNLADLGWSVERQQQFEQLSITQRGWRAARIAREEKVSYQVVGECGARRASLAGRLREALGPGERPAVGDWVAYEEAGAEEGVIRAVLPRRSAFVRQAAGRRSDGQVVAANVDVVFLVSGLDGDFNVRRIERYLALAMSSGTAAVVLLNKADVCDDAASRVAEAELVAAGSPVHVISALTGDGLDAVRGHLRRGRTAALLGSSGVGKSTVINALLGESRQMTRAVRADDSRGRHTTTHRELFVLGSGGVVIDTPGMRELQLPADVEVGGAFGDIEALASACRFRDCRHGGEPGCAVRAAIEDGTLPAERLASFQKLQREVDYALRREDPRLQRERVEEWKRTHKAARRHMKAKRRW